MYLFYVDRYEYVGLGADVGVIGGTGIWRMNEFEFGIRDTQFLSIY